MSVSLTLDRGHNLRDNHVFNTIFQTCSHSSFCFSLYSFVLYFHFTGSSMASIRCECKNTNYVLSLHEELTFLLCFRQQGICINMYFKQEMVPCFIKVLDFRITGYFIYIRNIRLNKSLFFWKKSCNWSTA